MNKCKIITIEKEVCDIEYLDRQLQNKINKFIKSTPMAEILSVQLSCGTYTYEYPYKQFVYKTALIHYKDVI